MSKKYMANIKLVTQCIYRIKQISVKDCYVQGHKSANITWNLQVMNMIIAINQFTSEMPILI